jgi:hypothetical protein
VALDRWDWHAGGDFPPDVPPENGGTHIGMFLAWAILNHLEGEQHRRAAGDDLRRVRAREMTGRDFLFHACDGKFWELDLSPEGLAFARWYYATQEGGYWPYLDDYIEVLAGELPTVSHVGDTWENFDQLAPVIEARFTEWKRRQGEQAASTDRDRLLGSS